MSGYQAYSGTGGFLRFLDRLFMHGLEAFRLFYGVYRAEVLSNTDDSNRGILRVRVPSVGDSDAVSRIAYPNVPLAGSGFGFKSLPTVGSFVWVIFENGRLDMPLWIGGMWGTDGVPEELRDPDQHGWYTPKGHKILLDEKDGQETIRITHKVGAKIEIDKDGNIRVFNADGKTLYIGLNANEAAVLGDTLKGLLDELFDALAALTVGTGTGPSTVPINLAQFQSIKARLQRILSQTVKVK